VDRRHRLTQEEVPELKEQQHLSQAIDDRLLLVQGSKEGRGKAKIVVYR
jgi:hypothetical protein